MTLRGVLNQLASVASEHGGTDRAWDARARMKRLLEEAAASDVAQIEYDTRGRQTGADGILRNMAADELGRRNQ